MDGGVALEDHKLLQSYYDRFAAACQTTAAHYDDEQVVNGRPVTLVILGEHFLFAYAGRMWEVSAVRGQNSVATVRQFVQSLFTAPVRLQVFDTVACPGGEAGLRAMLRECMAHGIRHQGPSIRLTTIERYQDSTVAVICSAGGLVENVHYTDASNVAHIIEEAGGGYIVDNTGCASDVQAQLLNPLDLAHRVLALKATSLPHVPQYSQLIEHSITVVLDGIATNYRRCIVYDGPNELLAALQQLEVREIVYGSEQLLQQHRTSLATSLIAGQLDLRLLEVLEQRLLGGLLYVLPRQVQLDFCEARSDNRTTEHLATPVTVSALDQARRQRLEQFCADSASPIAGTTGSGKLE